MQARMMTLAALLLPALALAVAAQKDKGKAKEKAYDTPQEVFTAAFNAVSRKDIKTFVTCYSPEAQKEMAGDEALGGLRFREILQRKGNEKFLEKFKPVLAVLDRHGLTEKATKDLNELDRAKASAAALKLIKDPAAFLVDYMEARVKANPGGEEEDLKPKLADVKVEGNKAKGMLVVTIDGRESKVPMEFVKAGAGWKIGPRPKPVEEKDEPKVARTPQECFDNFLAFESKGHYKAMVACLAPEAVKVMALELILLGNELRDFAEGRTLRDKDKDERRMEKERADELRPVFAVMDRHGLTVKATKDIKVEDGTVKERLKARLALLGLVKDLPAFCAEYLKAMRRAESFRRYGPRRDAKLADVKVDGEKATGNLVETDRLKDGGTREDKTPVAFVKVGDGWRIVPRTKKLDDKWFDPWGESRKR